MLSPKSLLALGLASVSSAAEIDTEGLPDTGLDTSSWTDGQLPPLSDMVNAHDFQIAAKNTLSGSDYAYYRTAALDEITYKANLFIWEKLRLNGFSFVDVSNLNIKTKILGHEFDAPFFIAPAAQAGRASSGAETNLVNAAGDAGILYIPSISSSQSTQDIADAGQDGQIMFHQAYPWADSDRTQRELKAIEDGGFKAVILTIDNTGINGIRDRQVRFSGASGNGHDMSFTAEALDEFRNMTSLPVVPKGVKTAHDVKLLADMGFPAVYISNHGGRQVDGTPTAIEILLDCHRLHPEVFDQVEIYVDGGVRRATHVLALLALGARAVGLGRTPMFANIYGQDGVDKLIDILRTELTTTMALMGETDIDGYRGNTTFINTRKIELDYLGAPIDGDLSSSPTSLDSPLPGAPTGSVSRTSPTVSSRGSSLTASSDDRPKTVTNTATSTNTRLTGTIASSDSPSASPTSLTCPASDDDEYTAPSGQTFLIECATDHAGGDVESLSVRNLKECVDACDALEGCVSVSLSGSACYLKGTLGPALDAPGIRGARVLE